MSEQSREKANEIKRYFKEVSQEAEHIQKTFPDKSLGDKLKKVQESSQEVVRHIEEKIKQG